MKTVYLLAFTVAFFTVSHAQVSMTLKPGASQGTDCTVYSGIPNGNFPADPYLASVAWTCNSNPCNDRALLKFDLSTIPSNVTIISASLLLFADSTNGIASPPMSGGANTSVIQMVTSPWLEGSTNWNTQPQTMPVDQVFLNQSTHGFQDYSADITSFVQTWHNIPSSNHGMMIRLIAENFYNSLIFASSDHPNTDLHPELNIVYIEDDSCVVLKPGSSGEDCTVFSGIPNSNFGNSGELMAVTWTCGGNPCTDRGLLRFDLSGLPQGIIINQATLRLFANPTSASFPNPMSGNDNTVSIEMVTTPWNENTVSWNSLPSSTSAGSVILAHESQSFSSAVADVTSIIQSWYSNPSSNYGMIMSLINEVPYNSRVFASGDHSNSMLHPELNICFSLATSVKSEEYSANLNVYPNPFNNEVVFQLSGLAENASAVVELYNPAGQLMLNGIVLNAGRKMENKLKLPDNLSSGAYVLMVKTEQTVFTAKLMH